MEGRGNPLKLLQQHIAMARETLADEWASAQHAEVLIYNSAAPGGYHTAEKLGVPAFASLSRPPARPS